MKTDARIDAVARAMTSAKPRGDFRARVLASLPARRPRRWTRFLVPVTVAVLIGSTAWLAGTVVRQVPVPATIARADSPVIPAEHTGAAGSVESAVAVGRVKPGVPVVSAEDLAWQSRAIPRLAPAESLAIPSIQPNALSIAPITMEPVAQPESIALAAIDSRAGGR